MNYSLPNHIFRENLHDKLYFKIIITNERFDRFLYIVCVSIKIMKKIKIKNFKDVKLKCQVRIQKHTY